MEYRQLGRSEIDVSVIGYGCWAIGGHKWGPVNDDESLKALKHAAAIGVNFFDTADFYGFGHSEELLAKAFGSNDNVIIATKGGLRWNSKGKIFHDVSKKHLVSACESSLQRLRRDTVDLYQIHWPDPDVPFEQALETLDSLVADGKIRYGGACNLSLEQLQQASNYPWFISYQDKLNLFNRESLEELIPFCLDNKVGFIAYQPLFKGMLTGKYSKKPVFEKGDHRKYRNRFTVDFDRYRARIDKLDNIASANNLSLTQLALAYIVHTDGVSSVIPGIKSVEQVDRNLEAMQAGKELIRSIEKEIYKAVSDG